MKENGSYSGIVDGLTGSIRLDRYTSEYLRLLSRSQIKSRSLEVKLNGKQVKISRLVKNGDKIELSWLPATPSFLEPENIDLELIYEDKVCAVINKSQGMIVHPGAGNHSGTLANALLWRALNVLNYKTAQSEMLNYRNGIVHRLDKDTSGVIITAYNDEALAFLSAQFKARTVRKRYLALVQGIPAVREGQILTRQIRDPRNRKRFTAIPAKDTGKTQGKIAFTRYRILKSWSDYSLLLLEPRTGRTHQLRVHLNYLGNPIIGDAIYNPLYKEGCTKRDKFFPDSSLMLHAYSLAITLPGKTEQQVFKAPLPNRFKTGIAVLNNQL